ncbi:MAG TPA: 8-amino-7-oxononanoate synthase [Verrucomicrobiae bacterium]|nr:8-amino-7-oxononanoate synthase [Verrucomicrobiae bacterium]
MSNFNEILGERLKKLRAQDLYRELRWIDSPPGRLLQTGTQILLNFASNDYLGLANEPALKEAAKKAVERYGAGAGASRLITGSVTPQSELEEALTQFKGTEAALSFGSGYAAAQGAIVALISKQDLVIVDRLVHACIVDATRLSGATLRVFAHNDVADLEHVLEKAQTKRAGTGNTLIITESVFSMDGDHAPLRELVLLKERYGAWLMVDEAHATGLYGPHRRGLAEELGVADHIEVQMGTLSKALGAAGGYICGSRALVDLLINRARPFIFSTAPVPAAAAAATAGIRFVQSVAGEERRKRLWTRARELSQLIGFSEDRLSAIRPLVVGDERRAMEQAAALRARGFLVPAIRFPAVAHGSARLRLTLSASHTAEDVQLLAQTLLELGLAPGHGQNGQSASQCASPLPVSEGLSNDA